MIGRSDVVVMETEAVEDGTGEKKFELMYEAYYELLYEVSNDILKDHFLAEDAVSMTFIRAAKNFEKLDRPISRKTRSFLIIICKRIAIDMYRSRKQENIQTLEERHSMEMPIDESLELKEIMGSLSEQHRMVLILRYYHGYSTKEIGQILSISESKVAKDLTNAKKELKKKLEDEGYTYETHG